MTEKFNIKIEKNSKSWFAFVIPVDFDKVELFMKSINSSTHKKYSIKHIAPIVKI